MASCRISPARTPAASFPLEIAPNTWSLEEFVNLIT
jgi:hypothetical protein